ncbi:MAG: hypothetical protein AAGC70_10475 [Pseudomonadota bacterium]
MTRTTFKLKGPALQRYVYRVIARRPELDGDTARTLSQDLGRLLVAANVRRIAWSDLTRRRRKRAPQKSGQPSRAAVAEPAKTRRKPASRAAKSGAGGRRSQREETKAVEKPAATVTPPPAAVATPPAGADFDPYAFGLVPIDQREGGEGLRSKLEAIKNVDHLRKMARAQQIGLPADIRRGDIALAHLRDAIVSAVEKRIADRRAAAS